MMDRREILKMLAAIAAAPAIPFIPASALADTERPPIYPLLTIAHPDLEEPIYIVASWGPDSVVSRGKTYLPLPLGLNIVDGQPRVSFEVPRDFQPMFEKFREAAQVKIEIAFGDDLDNPEPFHKAVLTHDGVLINPRLDIERWPDRKPPPLDLWS